MAHLNYYIEQEIRHTALRSLTQKPLKLRDKYLLKVVLLPHKNASAESRKAECVS